MKILEEEIRYPESGDQLFKEGGNPEEISWLHGAFQEFGGYADSYQTGALSLIDSALQDKNLRDYNIYPAIFLVRHYVELRLKELIKGIKYCQGDHSPLPAHHKIENLWGDFKNLYKQFGENPDNDNFKIVGELINELSVNDPNSMSFRYPVDKDGNKTQKLEYVNLNNLKETFIRMCFVLDGVAMLIGDRVENVEDLIRSMYHEE